MQAQLLAAALRSRLMLPPATRSDGNDVAEEIARVHLQRHRLSVVHTRAAHAQERKASSALQARLRSIVATEASAYRGIVVATAADSSYVAFAFNWHASVTKAGVRRPLVLCLDDGLEARLEPHGITTYASEYWQLPVASAVRRCTPRPAPTDLCAMPDMCLRRAQMARESLRKRRASS